MTSGSQDRTSCPIDLLGRRVWEMRFMTLRRANRTVRYPARCGVPAQETLDISIPFFYPLHVCNASDELAESRWRVAKKEEG